MTPDELENCRQVIKNLISDKYKDKNYLFLMPFDLSQTPGYMDVVSTVLDLSTISKRLEPPATHYTARDVFFQDVQMVFSNAIAYHSTRPESKWIVKPAKDMLKAASREKKQADKKLERKLNGGASDVPSTSLTAASVSSKASALGLKLPTKKNKKSSSEKKEGGSKLKIKLGKSIDRSSGTTPTGASTPGSVSSTSNKPKVTLKIKPPASSPGKQLPQGVSTPQSSKPKLKISTPSSAPGSGPPPEKKKIRLKLTMKRPKPPPEGGATTPKVGSTTPKAASTTPKVGSTTLKIAASTPKVGTMTPKSTSKSTSKSTPKVTPTTPAASTPKVTKPAPPPVTSTPTPAPAPAPAPPKEKSNADKIVIKAPAGPRGKELPKGVAPPKTTTKKATSTKKSTTKKASASKSGTAKVSVTKAGATKAKKSSSLTSKDSTKEKSSTSASASSTAKNPSTGKVLPTAVAAAAAAKSSSTTKKSTSKTKKSSSKDGKKPKISIPTPSTLPSAPIDAASAAKGAMTLSRKAQCSKTINGLKRRKSKHISWFLHPVSDKNLIQNYRSRIKNPMDITTMQQKLEKNEYPTVASYVQDLRRIFGNCLRFNGKGPLWPIAIEMLTTAEDLLLSFVIKNEAPGTTLYAPILFCWRQCLNILETLYGMTNPEDNQPTALYFMHPVSVYCGGQFPSDYLDKVSKPMDFGTITAQLVEAVYTDVGQFARDCELVIDNCNTYYGSREDGKVFTGQANRLKSTLQQQLDNLYKYISSPSGEQMKQRAITPSLTLNRPPPSVMLNLLGDLRNAKYTDKATKITEPSMALFEKPVSIISYPDYTQYVQSPMDLQTIERKIKGGAYTTPEDFEHDFLLMFNNCVNYNSARKSDHLVAMAKHGQKQFRKLFTSRMKSVDDGTVSLSKGSASKISPSSSKDAQRKAPPAGGAQQGPTKKAKVEKPAVSRAGGKTALRINGKIAPSSTDKPKQQKSSVTTPRPKPAPLKPNQPVPLHIAISRVKEAFPLRRAVKSLESWEADCARYFKEMMRHTWIGAARPKFIFHVPVPVLFPELRDAYAAKIQKPMDLTTVECTLLAGNRYTSPEEFIDDIALVFTNAIAFNKDGHDIGDPLSCAYYDASKHLLRYCRWLSLELLTAHLKEDDEADKGNDPNMPLTHWRLTTGNKTEARKEMEEIVMKEHIEKSMEGDRYTWMEAECEKLLKALRHQSDLRYMTFFIQPNYPPDYAAFISKPMDWERCQKMLKKRQYDTFGDVIADLRLIFSNALKYNARHEGTDTVSGRALDAARYMSVKLETAINKMMLSVSDRLEKERIDHNNAEREIEAAERAEAERIRAQWKSEDGKPEGEANAGPNGPPTSSAAGPPTTIGQASNQISSMRIQGATATSRLHASKRNNMRREANMDFELPFFDDEDNGQHERSYVEVIRQQKTIFEKQRRELSQRRNIGHHIGAALYARMAQHDAATKWLDAELKKAQLQDGNTEGNDAAGSNGDGVGNETNGPTVASNVLAKLDEAGRGPLQIKFAKKKKGTKRKRPLLSLE